MTDTYTPVGPYRASYDLIFDANSVLVMAARDDDAAFARKVADALNAAELPDPNNLSSGFPASRKLKPLVWEECDPQDGSQAVWSPFGGWEIVPELNNWEVYFMGEYEVEWALKAVTHSKEAAKALCEADYARRVDELFEENNQ